MKALIGLVLVGGLALLIFYKFAGYSSFDPTKDGEARKAKIAPGMSWSQVISAAGEPGQYKTFMKVKARVRGEDVEEVKEGPPMHFKKGLFEQDAAGNSMPEGFVFLYHFSEQSSFSVTFDGTAKVLAVNDNKTMADLLDSRKH